VSDVEKIAELCIRLGAPSEQAVVMARQLAKRADQISAERQVPREQALAQLLQILVEGRQGNVPATPGRPASGSASQIKKDSLNLGG
jgi:hypothetical protein